MEEKIKQVKEILQKYEQEHLLSNYDNLNEEKKEELLNEILQIDFEQMNNLYESVGKNTEDANVKIEPISYVEKATIEENKKQAYFENGAEAIKQNKLAIVTMAGGQGTRLGHNGPKGTFYLNVSPEEKSIFELLCDTLKRANKKYGVCIPWYIMTSRENNGDTVKFFEENNYFNYNKNDIKFFVQGELPMLSTSGKVLLNEEGTVKLAADGHGGVFESMFKNGVVEDMRKRNIEWIFVGPVDNPLAGMIDEVLIGLSEEQKAMSAGKSVVKANPSEKVGVFCLKNGKPSVVEYTEISEEMANRRDENGGLAFGESHINCNMFNIKGIEKIGAEKLPYHVAFKKASYMDENGEIVTPTEPNAYKFESFIFDAFEKLDNMTILRVKREDEFAPVKNAEGTDSPETAIKLYNEFHRKEV